MTDQEPLAEAIKTALTAAVPASTPVCDLDEVTGANATSGDLPRQFVLVQVSRQYEESRRFGGGVMVPVFRLDTTYHAPNVQSCRELRRRVSAALEDVTLPGDIGPFAFNDETQPIDVDNQFHGYSGIDTWTF